MDNGRKLRIGLDLTGLWRPATGVFVYAIELARNLLSLDDRNQYTLFFSNEIHAEFRELDGRFKAIIIPVREEILSKQFIMALLCNALKLDVIHFPSFPPPLLCFRRFIWTLHDATAWLYPETQNWKARFYFRDLGARTAGSSRALVTVSNESKRNLVKALRVPEDKVKVIYEGIDTGVFRRVRDQALLSSVRARYGLPERFLLTVATLEPKKNLPFLVQGHRRLRKTNQPGIGLVIVGRKGWKTQAIDRSLSESEGGVIVTGFVPREDLVALYSLAEVFVLPSLYEGFGFPPLEAMACGCPVIVSNRGALPETVGKAAVLIDPEDLDSFVEAVRSVLTNPQYQRALVEKGLARVKEFSWRTAASKTLDLYKEVAARS